MPLLTKHVNFSGFAATDLERWGRVLGRHAEAGGAPAAAPGLLAITAHGQLRKLWSSRLAPLARPEDLALPPAQLAERYGARWVLEVREGALAEVADRFARRLEPEREGLAQFCELYRVLTELEARGDLSLWPRSFRSFFVPDEILLRRALDLVCPPRQAIALGIFAEGELFVALAAERAEAGFERVLGTQALRGAVGLLSGEWHRDCRYVAEAVQSTLAPLALGCFAELHSLRTILADPEPGAWSRAVAARDIVLSPASPALMLPLGLDLGRAALRGLRSWAVEFPFAEILKSHPFLDRAQTFLDDDLRRILGFDVWGLLRRIFEKQ